MGVSTKSVPMFDDTITINPHSGSPGVMLDKPVKIKEFAAGERVSLEEIEETGELLVTTESGRFLQGAEVVVD